MSTIKAPNKQYNGVSAGVQFVKGQAETDDKWLICWFKNRGYEVIEDSTDDENPEEVDFSKLKNEEIKAKLDELSVEYKANDTKAELLEKLNEVIDKVE